MAGGGWRRPEYICQLQNRGLQTEREKRGERSLGQTCRILCDPCVATQPPVLYLAFLHLFFFLLFVPAWGSLLHGSLLQGVLPLPSPHFLQGQGMGLVSSATLQPAPSLGRHTQHRSCHPKKSQHLSRQLLQGRAPWESTQQTAQSSESKAGTRAR